MACACSLPFVNFRSSYSDFAAKYGKEERFRGIEKTRERESLFADFLVDLRYKEKEESRNQKEKVLSLFNGILFVISEARLHANGSRVTLESRSELRSPLFEGVASTALLLTFLVIVV